MEAKGINISDWHNYKGDKRTLFNNCVEAELGSHILNCFEKAKERGLF